MTMHGWQGLLAASRASTQAERVNAIARNQEETFLAALNEEVRMDQAPFPPGRECSTTRDVEPGEKRERVRTISPQEQEAIEEAPYFDVFCAWLYRLTQAERAKRESPRPPEAA